MFFINNFFDFATKEISHSAFWAWVLNSVDKRGGYNIPSKLGVNFLKTILFKKAKDYNEIDKVSVTTEYCPPGSTKKIDIFVEVNETINIVIENKLNAIPSKEQLNKYYEIFGSNTLFVFVNLGYDYDFNVPEPWLKFTIEDILNLFEGINIKKHFLIKEYYNWLYSRNKYFLDLESGIFSPNLNKVERSLSTMEGQWKFFNSLFDNFFGQYYKGYNNDGSCQTQFWFFNLPQDHEMKEQYPYALFYRVDKYRRKGYYLSLRQYLHIPTYIKNKNLKEPQVKSRKKEDLKKLRFIWQTSVKKINFELKAYRPNNRGVFESEIGCFIIDDVNHPSKLRTVIPNLHNEFLCQLRNEGWPIEIGNEGV
ncbi:MAG: PD-(D/E)XK nuclease family protein [Candidatus Woesearchaeota archaeon]